MQGDVHTVSQESLKEALDESVKLAKEKSKDGTDIESDAAHSACRGALKTNVLALDLETHKLVTSSVITSVDDPSPHRHEKIGTQNVYY